MKVILSPDALAELQEIGDFIGQDNLDAAASFVARLKARCFDLGTFPNAILHVIHGKRDLGKALKD